MNYSFSSNSSYSNINGKIKFLKKFKKSYKNSKKKYDLSTTITRNNNNTVHSFDEELYSKHKKSNKLSHKRRGVSKNMNPWFINEYSDSFFKNYYSPFEKYYYHFSNK